MWTDTVCGEPWCVERHGVQRGMVYGETRCAERHGVWRDTVCGEAWCAEAWLLAVKRLCFEEYHVTSFPPVFFLTSNYPKLCLSEIFFIYNFLRWLEQTFSRRPGEYGSCQTVGEESLVKA